MAPSNGDIKRRAYISVWDCLNVYSVKQEHTVLYD